jgi:hypothetical protein
MSLIYSVDMTVIDLFFRLILCQKSLSDFMVNLLSNFVFSFTLIKFAFIYYHLQNLFSVFKMTINIWGFL